LITIGDDNFIENCNDVEQLTSSEFLIMLLYCGSIAYKCAITISGNQSSSFPSLWYDLGISYYKMYENLLKKK
jgi:hypothetical protein